MPASRSGPRTLRFPCRTPAAMWCRRCPTPRARGGGGAGALLSRQGVGVVPSCAACAWPACSRLPGRQGATLPSFFPSLSQHAHRRQLRGGRVWSDGAGLLRGCSAPVRHPGQPHPRGDQLGSTRRIAQCRGVRGCSWLWGVGDPNSRDSGLKRAPSPEEQDAGDPREGQVSVGSVEGLQPVSRDQAFCSPTLSPTTPQDDSGSKPPPRRLQRHRHPDQRLPQPVAHRGGGPGVHHQLWQGGCGAHEGPVPRVKCLRRQHPRIGRRGRHAGQVARRGQG